jgi:hypothetical protein
MLRKHEIDLIAGLVEGSLEDESEARALVAKSDEARAEYEMQNVAYEALRDAEPVSMTENEKATLHRDLWTALRQAPQPAPKRTPWYFRLAPVAAALFVVVGLGAVLTQGVLNQQSGDEAATAQTFAEASDGVAAETTRADSGGTEEAADTTGGLSDDAGGEAADLADGDAAALAPALTTAFTDIAEAVRTKGDIREVVTFRSFATSEESEEVSQCLESAGLPNYLTIGEFDDPSGGDATYLVVVQSNDEIGPDTRVVFIDTETCQIAHIES